MTIRCYSYSDNYAFQVLLNGKSELKKCNIDNGTIPRFGWCPHIIRSTLDPAFRADFPTQDSRSEGLPLI